MVTMSLSAAVWSQFSTQVFREGQVTIMAVVNEFSMVTRCISMMLPGSTVGYPSDSRASCIVFYRCKHISSAAGSLLVDVQHTEA